MATLVVTHETVFKTKPVQSSELPDEEKVSISEGEFALSSFEEDGNHLRVTLVNPVSDRKEWYVFKEHGNILDTSTIVVTKDTVFKTQPLQSADLSDSEKLAVENAKELAVKSYDERGNHLLVTLANPLGDRKEWYVFQGHIDLLEIEDYPPPEDEPEPIDLGKLIRLPGRGQVRTGVSIIPDGNFTWSEATKNGNRIPANERITDNIINMAKRMEEVRSRLGDRPIVVTSWYRPPRVNAAVGGVPNSTHLRGYAVDFIVRGLTPREVQRELDPWWSGGLGYGNSFTHLDNRGYRARWNYS